MFVCVQHSTAQGSGRMSFCGLVSALDVDHSGPQCRSARLAQEENESSVGDFIEQLMSENYDCNLKITAHRI